MKSYSVVAIIDDGPFKCHICQVSSSVLSESRWFSKSSRFLWSPQWKHKQLQLCRSVLRWSMLAPSAAHGATGCFQFRSLIPDPMLRSCLLQCCFPSAKIFTSRSWSGPQKKKKPGDPWRWPTIQMQATFTLLHMWLWVKTLAPRYTQIAGQVYSP